MKLCLCLFALILLLQQLPAQTLTHTAGNINVNIPAGVNILSRDSSAAQVPNARHVWIETGDGNYITNIPAHWSYPVTGRALGHSPFLMATALYDTIRRPPSQSSAAFNKQTGTPSPVYAPLLAKKSVKLFASANEMVNNDTMVFGISYKTPVDGQGNIYRVVLKYNNNGQAFTPITSNTQTNNIFDSDINAYRSINAARAHAGEEISIPASGSFAGYTNAVVFGNISWSLNPRNVFVTLVPQNITTGTYTNIEAELQVQGRGEAWSPVETDLISNFKGEPSHDPNDINVQPTCLLLPQKKTTLHYAINFQNIGGGPATAVKLVFFTPKQINWSKKVWNLKASFGVVSDYDLTDIEYDEANGRIIFTIPESAGHVLQGTGTVENAAINPATMGRVEFDLETIPETDAAAATVIKGFADIYFNSQWPSADTVTTAMTGGGQAQPGTAGYEKPIRTNNALTDYKSECSGSRQVTGKKTCNCSNPGSIWNWVCCYWWVLVIVILLIFVLRLLRRRRRRV